MNKLAQAVSASELADRSHTDPYLTDAIGGALNGPSVAGSNTADLLDRLSGGQGVDTSRPFGETTTSPGGLVEGISTFVSSMLLLGGNPAAGIEGAEGFAARRAVDFVTSASVFKGDQGRLSDMFSGTRLENPISEFLATNKDEGWLTARLKSALEATGLAGATDLLTHSLSLFKKVQSGKAVSAADLSRLNEELAQFQADRTKISLIGPHLTEDRLPQTIAASVKNADGSAVPIADAVKLKDSLKAAARATNQPFDAFIQNKLWGVRGYIPKAENPPQQYAVQNGKVVLGRFSGSMSDVAGVADSLAKEGRGIMTLYQTATPDTWAHEISHLIRFNLPDDQIKSLESAFGSSLTNGRFPPEVEEKFAKVLQARIVNGDVPDSVVKNAVTPVAAGVKHLFESLSDSSSISDEVSPELKSWFDKNVTSDFSGVSYTGSPEDNVRIAKGLLESLNGPRPNPAKAYSGINLIHFGLDDDPAKIAATASQVAQSVIDPTLAQSKSLDQSVAGAQKLIAKWQAESGLDSLAQGSNDAKQMLARVVESRLAVAAVTNQVTSLAHAVTNGGSAEDVMNFLKAVEQHQGVMNQYRSTAQSLGRAVNAYKFDPMMDKGKLLQDLINRGGASEATRLAQAIAQADDMGAGVRNIDRLIQGNKWLRAAVAFRTGAILTPPSSLLRVQISQALNTALRPMEKIIGGIGRGAVTGDFSLAREGVGTYLGMTKVFADAARSASDAFRADAAILDPIHNEYAPALSGSAFGKDGTNIGTAIDWLGKTIGIGQRFHMASAEFYKQLNYHALLYSQYAQEAVEKGLTGDGASAYIDGKLQGAVDELGKGTDPRALLYAQQQTYTQTPGKLGQWLIKGANDMPWIRFIMPFITIPTNEFANVVGHTPIIGAILKDTRDALRAGGNARAEVLGRWATGGMFYAGALLAASQGLLTGSGGPDRGANAMKRISGWQPYSIAVSDGKGGNKYYSYNRIDPIGSFLGMAADFHELSAHAAGPDLENAAYSMLGATSKDLLDKTFLKGLSDVVSALHDPSPGMAKYGRGFLTSFIPSITNTFNPDPKVREVNSLFDAIKARIPGLSEQLAPKRNVLGEPIDKSQSAFLPSNISPIAYSETSPDPVKQELANLSRGLRNPTPVEYGTDLSQIKLKNGQSAYDRRLELIGQTEIGGLKITDALSKLIKSQSYQALVQGGDALLPSRQTAVESVLNRYRVQSLKQLLTEHPEIAKHMQQTKLATVTKQVSSLKTALFNLKQQGQR